MRSRFLWLTFGQAIGAALAVSVIAQAYRVGEPAFVSVCEYAFLVFAALWGFILWGQTTDLWSLIGIIIIILSGVIMFMLDRLAADASPGSDDDPVPQLRSES